MGVSEGQKPLNFLYMMSRRCSAVLFFLSLGTLARAAEAPAAPLLAVEAEHASGLRGPARLCRDNGASLSQAVELGGDGALVRLPDGGDDTAAILVAAAPGVAGQLIAALDRFGGLRPLG